MRHNESDMLRQSFQYDENSHPDGMLGLRFPWTGNVRQQKRFEGTSRASQTCYSRTPFISWKWETPADVNPEKT